MRLAAAAAVAATAALTLVLVSERPAAAQPEPTEPSPVIRPTQSEEARKEAARVHFERAQKLHAEKRYLEAADAYLAAFSEVPLPAFLYNAGQVYRLAGEREKAIEHYRRYLELEPDGEGSADARAFLAELEREPEPAAKEDPIARGGGTALSPPPASPARDTGETSGRSLRIAALISFGVGAIALGAGAGFAFKASSASDDLSAHRGEWGPAEQDLYRAGEDAERYMMISLGVGAVAVAAGGVLYLFSRRGEPPPATVAPTASGGAIVLLGARF